MRYSGEIGAWRFDHADFMVKDSLSMVLRSGQLAVPGGRKNGQDVRVTMILDQKPTPGTTVEITVYAVL